MNALRDAGFVSASFQQVPQVWRIVDPDKLFDMVAGGTVRAAATLRAQTSQAREFIRAALRATVITYKCGDYFEVPMPAVLATAVKP